MADPGSGRSPATVVNALLAVNLAVFFLWIWTAAPPAVMAEHFLVSCVHLAERRVWVLLTAVFSHNLVLHLLINMFVLTSFAPSLE